MQLFICGDFGLENGKISGLFKILLLEGLAESTLILDGGYQVPGHDDIVMIERMRQNEGIKFSCHLL